MSLTGHTTLNAPGMPPSLEVIRHPVVHGNPRMRIFLPTLPFLGKGKVDPRWSRTYNLRYAYCVYPDSMDAAITEHIIPIGSVAYCDDQWWTAEPDADGGVVWENTPLPVAKAKALYGIAYRCDQKDATEGCGEALHYEMIGGMRVHTGGVYKFRCPKCGNAGTNNGRQRRCPGKPPEPDKPKYVRVVITRPGYFRGSTPEDTEILIEHFENWKGRDIEISIHAWESDDVTDGVMIHPKRDFPDDTVISNVAGEVTEFSFVNVEKGLLDLSRKTYIPGTWMEA